MRRRTNELRRCVWLVVFASGFFTTTVSAETLGNCVSGPLDPTQGRFYAIVFFGNVNGVSYCTAAYRDTDALACAGAWAEMRAFGFGPDVPGSVSTAPPQVGQWGTCAPYGAVVWLTDAPPCPVQPLSQLTAPDAIRFENGDRWRPDLLTAEYQGKLQCVTDAITQAGGSYTPGSAWRPTEYQKHLYEIVTKDSELDPQFMRKYLQCVPLRSIVTQEMGRHSLRPGQLVGKPGRSRHEFGQAFDITPALLSAAQVDSIAAQCGVSRRALPSEPWHFQ